MSNYSVFPGCIVACFASISAAYGQVGVPEASTPHTFELASIRLVWSGRWEAAPGQVAFGPRTWPVKVTGNRLTAETSLLELIQTAFEVRHYQVVGSEDLSNRIYQLTALVPDGTSQGAIPAMLRHLLAERLGLKVHVEKRVQNIRALLVAETGHKLTEVQDPANPKKRDVTLAGTTMKASTYLAPGTFFSSAIDMDTLARTISSEYDEPVINSTGLDKVYTIDIRWVPHLRDGVVPGASGSDSEFPRALLKQLGLRIEKKRLPLNLLVIDQVNLKPTEN